MATPPNISSNGPGNQNSRPKVLDMRVCPTLGIDIAELAVCKLYELYGIHHPSIRSMADQWTLRGPKNVNVLLPASILAIDSPTVTEAYLTLRLIAGVQVYDIKT